MKLKHSIYFPFALLLTACAETAIQPASTDPITAAIAGKTLVWKNARFVSNADGTTVGNVGDEEYVGVWNVTDGKLCNQYTKPERFSKPACLDTTLNGDGTITVATRSGSAITWTILD